MAQSLDDAIQALGLDEQVAAAWVLDGVEPPNRVHGPKPTSHTPANSPRKATVTRPEPEREPVFTHLGDQRVQLSDKDPLGAAGKHFMVHNTLWPHDADSEKHVRTKSCK